MRAYSLKTVKAMVAAYNETKSADRVADKLSLPLRDIKAILVWLHKHDPINAQSVHDEEFALALPTNHVWVQFLYLHDIPAHTAAACLNWPLHRLLGTCGGPEQWAKHSGRKPIKLHENDVLGCKYPERRPGDDPTEEEVEARKREIQEAWSRGETVSRGGVSRGPGSALPKPKRVEIKSYVYDGRAVRFDEM